jgi:hypothetical protein
MISENILQHNKGLKGGMYMSDSNSIFQKKEIFF